MILTFFNPAGVSVYATNVNSGDWPAPGDLVMLPGLTAPARVADREFVYAAPPAALVEVRVKLG
jgi:hypothetical protein